MESIKEKSEEYVWGFHPSIQRMCKESFEDGANYVIDGIEKYMNNLNLGNNSIGRLNKLVLIANIHDFIEQLKGNQ